MGNLNLDFFFGECLRSCEPFFVLGEKMSPYNDTESLLLLHPLRLLTEFRLHPWPLFMVRGERKSPYTDVESLLCVRPLRLVVSVLMELPLRSFTHCFVLNGKIPPYNCRESLL